MKKLLLIGCLISSYVLAQEEKNSPKDLAFQLFYAAAHGPLNVVKNLIENCKLNPNSISDKDPRKAPPLYYAIRGRQLDIVKYLIEDQKVKTDFIEKGGLTLLHQACRWPDLAIVQYLIEKQKMSPYVQDDCAQTPLFEVIFGRNNLDTLEYLLSFIDPNIQNGRGETPLQSALALTSPNIKTIKLLLFNGARVDLPDKYGVYPFEMIEDSLNGHNCNNEIFKLITPLDRKSFLRNPQQYKKTHPQEFNPVSRFPEEFEDLRKQEIVKPIKGSKNILNYLKNREIGGNKKF